MNGPRENKELVTRAVEELFITKDVGAIDRYFAEPYLQHNPMLPNGLDGLRGLAQHAIVANAEFKAERLCVVGDGALVAVYHRYQGFGPVPMLAVDLFRVTNGKIVEHWDCLEAETTESAKKCAKLVEMSDGPESDSTEHSRRVVSSFVETALVKPSGNIGDEKSMIFPALSERVTQSLRSRNEPLRYLRIHRVLADGNFVVTQAEAEAGDKLHVCYDLFHVEGGVMTRHWSVVQEVPQNSVSGLTMF